MLSGTTGAATSAVTNFEKISAKIQDTKNTGDGLTRQICRKWLKHTFLGLGTECSEGSGACPRKHDLPTNLNLLYKDYSFKGLTTQQRKKIISKAKEVGDHETEQEKTASSVTQGRRGKGMTLTRSGKRRAKTLRTQGMKKRLARKILERKSLKRKANNSVM